MRRLLKWVGIVLGAMILLVAIGVLVVYLTTNERIGATYSFVPAAPEVEQDSLSIARGRHIAEVRGCVECHGDDLGGAQVIDEPMIARLAGSNLTSGRGGVASQYETPAAWVRAIRHGIGADGRPLIFMPSHEYQVLSEEDVSDLIAYIVTRPPVEREMPEITVGPVGRLLFAMGELPLLPAEFIDHENVRPAARVEAAPTRAFGEYLATACAGCHGHDFAGGRIPGTPPDFPPATNLTPDGETGLGSWSRDDFFRALREGVRPDGSSLAPQMPVRLTSRMTDVEIEALWEFFRSLDPLPEKTS